MHDQKQKAAVLYFFRETAIVDRQERHVIRLAVFTECAGTHFTSEKGWMDLNILRVKKVAATSET
jgi:hypothetical protein